MLLADILQLFEGGEPGALGDFVMTADAFEGAGGGAVGEIDGSEGVLAGLHFGKGLVGDLRFETHVAATKPIGLDEGFDEKMLLGTGGTELSVVVAGERFEQSWVFAGDHGELSVGSVAEGVQAGGGLTFIGARTGGLDRIQAVGGDLRRACHTAER